MSSLLKLCASMARVTLCNTVRHDLQRRPLSFSTSILPRILGCQYPARVSPMPHLLQPCRTVTMSLTQILEERKLHKIHKKGKIKRKRPKPKPTSGNPFLKGVVLKTLIKKPKKPNSANRKCVRVKLTNGSEQTAYIPGEGHNLQEHHIVLVRCGRVQDLPGVKLKCIRGKYDLQHVKK